MSNRPLAGEFPALSKADWLRLVQKGEAGGPPSSLRSALYEGFDVEAMADRADFAAIAARLGGAVPILPEKPAAERPWRVIQLLDHAGIGDANAQLREDLSGGADGVWLQLGGNIPYAGDYVSAGSLDDFEMLFAGVDLAGIEIHVSGGFDALPGLAMLLALAQKRGCDPAALRGSAGLDPLSIVAVSGYVPADRRQVCADSVDAALGLRAMGCGMTPFLVSGRAWHQAGASAVEELGFALAASAGYWRELEAAGVTAAEATGMTGLALAAEPDLFLTIAKFRAARLLWTRAAELCGAAGRPVPIFAEMSYRCVAARDPHVNLLRATAAAFGAGVGGADAVMLIPFNAKTGTPDAFGRRLARNAQLVLMEEAHVGRVADPAAGSWHIEALTHDLARAAWERFRETEAAGGLLAALEAGKVGDALNAVSRRRERNVARGADPITGVSSFPDLAEKPVTVHASGGDDPDIEKLSREAEIVALPAPGSGERLSTLVEAARQGAGLRSLEKSLERIYERREFLAHAPIRVAEPFESLRSASDRALARVGARPPVFMAVLGVAAEYTPRLTWAKSFFEAGGLEPAADQSFESLDRLQRAFRDSASPVACLCAADKRYAAMPGAALALKSAGAAAVYAVCPPEGLGSFGPEDQRAIDRIVYPGCDMLSVLEELHQILRVGEIGVADYDEYDEDDD